MQEGPNPWRVLTKGIFLFLIFEFLLLAWQPHWGSWNAYAAWGLERQRFPISTISPIDDALDVGDLDAMFASHVISRPKAPDEFRLLVLGDSAVWGLQLEPEQTLPGQLDLMHLNCGAKNVRIYNLSFPRSSATKDLMILDKALEYQPDMIVWLVTWYTLMPKTRVDHWLATQNPEEFEKLGRRFDFLPKDYQYLTLSDKVFDRQRALFRGTRYQLYSVIELATGLDQIPGQPEVFPPELSTETTFEGMQPPTLRKSQVSLDQVKDFYELAGSLPVLLINEPMLVLTGIPNSDIRYNAYYPRWVYDQYRRYLGEAATENGWNYLDLWNGFTPDYFSDSPLHLTPDGERRLAETVAPAIERECP